MHHHRAMMEATYRQQEAERARQRYEAHQQAVASQQPTAPGRLHLIMSWLRRLHRPRRSAQPTPRRKQRTASSV